MSIEVLNVDDVKQIHHQIIKKYGGDSTPVTNEGIKKLEIALNSIYAGFGGVDKYDTICKKASILLESMTRNHQFIDGNKRVGYATFELFLNLNGFKMKKINQKTKEKFVLSVVNKKIEFETIDNCCKKATKSLN